MKRQTTSYFFLVAASGIALAGCPVIIDVADELAHSAPPARPPEIRATFGMHRWNGNTDYFIIDSTFELDVRHGFLNHLTLLTNGVAVPEFDGNDPNNGMRTTQTIHDTSSDESAKTTVSRVKIFGPVAGYAEGQVLTFTLLEESINPDFKGTAQESATSAFTVVRPVPPADITDYMKRCFRHGVPIPPDWAETGTAWVLQGNIAGNNLLDPGQNAFVYTYSDPRFRGGCIALPRGVAGGMRGGLAGIICQSAVTGAACFWDSRKRDNDDPMREMPRIDWKNEQPLVIAELKDASNLTEIGSGVCTECHRGNNVFLISPDNATWAEVMRGSLVSAQGSTFTTRVEESSQASSAAYGGRPRYVPMAEQRPGWDNPRPDDPTPQAPKCAAACHEQADVAFTRFPTMPPSCATPNVESCYAQ